MTPPVVRVPCGWARCVGLLAALVSLSCCVWSARAQSPQAAGGGPAGESSWTVDVAASRIYVFVDKGSLIGHSHAIVGRLAGGELMLGRREQAGRLVFDMRSMLADTPEARTALKLDGDVDASTRNQTTANMLGPDVLDVARHPIATFAIQSALPVGQAAAGQPMSYRLDGTFTLRGAARPLAVTVTFEPRAEDAVMRGRFTLTQTDFGIHPYAKLGGIISIADALQVYGGLRLVHAAGEAEP